MVGKIIIRQFFNSKKLNSIRKYGSTFYIGIAMIV